MKTNKGFTLVQTMVALGIMAVASVGLMKVTKQTAKTTKRAEVFQNIFTIENRSNLLMVNSENCTATLATADDAQIRNGKDIIIRDVRTKPDNTQIVTEVFQGGVTYFNNTVQIDSIKIVDKDLVLDVDGINKVGSAAIEIRYKKISKILEQEKTQYIKKIPIPRIITDQNDNLIMCQSDESLAAQEAAKRLCHNLGGNFDSTSQCVYVEGDVPVNKTELLEKRLDPRYVNVTGDEMEGDLIVAGNITSRQTITTQDAAVIEDLTVGQQLTASKGIRIPEGEKICLLNAQGMATKCIDPGAECLETEIFAGYKDNGDIDCRPAACPTGLVSRYDSTGKLTCTRATCDDNEYVEGYLANGEPICNKVPFSQCGAGQYILEVITDVNGNGKAVCEKLPPSAQGECDPGYYLQGYFENGSKNCQKAILLPEKGCTKPEVLIGFKPNGDPICDRPIIGQTCLNPEDVFMGFDANGLPDCRPPKAYGETCDDPNDIFRGYDKVGDAICVSPAPQPKLEMSPIIEGKEDRTIALPEDYDMCFLTKAGSHGIGGSNNKQTWHCEIKKNGNRFSLETYVANGNNNNPVCAAQCMRLCAAPVGGGWTTVSRGSCSCEPGKTRGIQTVRQTCQGSRCGGSCDPALKATSQACSCSQSRDNCRSDQRLCKRPDDPSLSFCVSRDNQCPIP